MTKESTSWFVYIIRCADGTLYTGISNNVAQRIFTHNAGKGAKYTKPKTRRPVTLLYVETLPTKGEALSREHAIKKLKREAKLTLIADNLPKTPYWCGCVDKTSQETHGQSSTYMEFPMVYIL